MPDVYATIAQQPREIVETLAQAMEIRAASAQQQAFLESYLSHINFPQGARVLEMGCGTGPVTQVLAQWPGVAEVVGVDPSPVMLEKAKELRGSIPNLSFQEGDGRSLTFGDESFDVVVIHTALTHIPNPEAAISEAFRVLRSEGWVAIFDGDYATITASIHPQDPLAACVEAFKSSYINDLYIVRKLAPLVTSSGFRIVRSDSYSYVETSEPGHLLTIVDRGADTLATSGSIGDELAAAFKAEARRRFEAGEFFGHYTYGSVIARKL